MKLDIKFEDDSLNKLIRHVEDVTRKAPEKLQAELDKSGFRIETGAKERTIVDTGRLRSSIHVKTINTPKKHAYSDGKGNTFVSVLDVIPKKLEAYVGTNVEYAYKIHSDGGVKTNAILGGNGKGFLFNSYEADKPKLMTGLNKVLDEALNEIR